MRKLFSRMIMIAGIAIACGLSYKFYQAGSSNPQEAKAKELFKQEYNFKEMLRTQWGQQILQEKFPTEAHLNMGGVDKEVKIQYTIDSRLQDKAETLLKSYKPDFGAIVVMDAQTGRILALTSFDKDSTFDKSLALMANSPAASIFKVITATAAVDHAKVNPDHIIKFNGGNYTLYKKNVMTDKINRWTRRITFRDAFARSINTAFGRIALEELQPKDLSEYADRYFFNKDIVTDFPLEMSLATIPTEKSFELTQVASGYNRFNRISPVHGAMIAATVINNGIMPIPYIYQQVQDKNTHEVLFDAKVIDQHRVMSEASASQVQEMMSETITSGTSRNSFKPLTKDRKFRDLEMGGKTGHFSAENPKGRVDWFVGFASNENQKIAVAALTISKKFWTVKSSHLGQTLFREYFKQENIPSRRLTSVNPKDN